MTPSRYFIARFAQAFGYYRRSHRLGDAASEMHLLREAEAYLGSCIWTQVEGLEPLTVEYWNLRKLVKEKEEVNARLAACQLDLDRAHEDRATLINSTPESNQEFFDERTSLLSELEVLAQQRDVIVGEARDVRRTYVGLKMKLEVLTKESTDSPPNQAAIAQVQTRLMELKTRFAELKEERIRIGTQIQQGDIKVDRVDVKIQAVREARRSHAATSFQVIGERNREMSILRAESGLLETQLRQLHGEIGRYVSRHANHDPACAAAAASYQGIIDVMQALRRSIALNHRLAK